MLEQAQQLFINTICRNITQYLLDAQDFEPGEYYGSFWSEKAYHGPLVDWHAGGAHHHRSCGSAALMLWNIGKVENDQEIMHRAEIAFDWLVVRQHQRGGWTEVQNNENPSDWEHSGLVELSTISTGFAVHGLAQALLDGLPPKKSYMDCLKQAGHWFLSIEWPAGSGIFPHHERSPYNTLNANMHAADALMLIYRALKDIYGISINIFLQGVRRAVARTLESQWEDGCMPYRDYGGATINYTSLVIWCMLNALDNLPEEFNIPTYWVKNKKCDEAITNSCKFLRGCINDDGSFKWDEFETSTAKHNIWTYFITINVLLRVGQEENVAAAKRLLKFVETQIGADGLPRMRDEIKEDITKCAYMQADILMFILQFSTTA
jgi:hypothetical protein